MYTPFFFFLISLQQLPLTRMDIFQIMPRFQYGLLCLLYNVMKNTSFSVYFIFSKSYNIFTKALVVKTTSLKQLSLFVLSSL